MLSYFLLFKFFNTHLNLGYSYSLQVHVVVLEGYGSFSTHTHLKAAAGRYTMLDNFGNIVLNKILIFKCSYAESYPCVARLVVSSANLKVSLDLEEEYPGSV